MNKKPIRLIELFAGIGTQYQALKRIGTDVESYLISDWNIPSNIAYKAMLKVTDGNIDDTDYSANLTHDEVIAKLNEMGLSLDGKNPLPLSTLKRKGEKWQRNVYNEYLCTNNLGSITNIHAEDLGIVDKDLYDYIMTYSFPCLTGDTKCLTDKGEVLIKDIKIGDRVYTHKNTYERVLASKMTGHKLIYEVKTAYTTVRCTDNHKFYVRSLISKDKLGNPYWLEAINLTKNCYVGYIGGEYPDVVRWIPIEAVTNTGIKEDVYDIEVENAHSFVANNIIVHNCQDLSLAGKQAGMKKGSGTRSGLLWEVERLLQESTDKGLELPDVLLMENVPQVCSGKNKEDFEDWKNFLSSLGYKNFVKILDAADFEVPQSRKRCFMVSILKDVSYEFPEAIPLTRCISDILEIEVDEKYYINTPKAKELIQSLIDRGELSDRNVFCADGGINNPKIKSISNCITARQDRGISNRASEGNVIVEKKPIQLGNIMEENGFKNPQCGRVYDKNACSPTLNTCNGGNHEPKIIVDDIYNSREARIYKEYSPALRANRQGFKTIVAMRGRPVCNPNLQIAGLPTKQRLEINKEGISNTLTTVQKDNLVLENIIYDDYNNNIPDEQSRIGTIAPTCGNSALRNGKKIIERVEQISSDNSQCGTVVSDEGLFPTLSAGCHGYANPHIYTQYRVRKLTPKECGRLMGVDDAVIDSMGKVLSNSKLYQCFGNAIVVDVLCAIFSQLEIIREK